MTEEKEQDFIKWYSEVGIADVLSVGGKNAALGEMYSNLVPLGVNVPDGFAITAQAYRFFFKETGLGSEIRIILADLNTSDIRNLQSRARKVREAILKAILPETLAKAISEAYKEMAFFRDFGKKADRKNTP